MAVSVLTAAELDRMESHNVAQIAGLAPSVTFSQNSDYSQLTIRGIGSNVVFAGSDSSSAVYVDGVYIARPVMVLTDFLDFSAWKSSVARRDTVWPECRWWRGECDHEVSDERGRSRCASRCRKLRYVSTEARLSGPIVRNRLLGSVAFLRGVSDGFVRDLDHPDRPLGGEDATAALGKLHIVFNGRTDLLLTGDISHKDPIPLTYAKVLAVKPGFQVDNPVNLHEVRMSTLAKNRTLQYGASARFTANVAAGTT